MHPQVWSQVPWSLSTQVGWAPRSCLLPASKASTEASKTARMRPRRGAGREDAGEEAAAARTLLTQTEAAAATATG